MDTDTALRLLDSAWKNIRHNESLRNTLFALHVTISSVFLVLAGEEKTSLVTPETLAMVGWFLWAVGLLFVWSFVRLKAMIDRDSRITRLLNEHILRGSEFENVLDAYESFFAERDKKHLYRFGTVSTCVISTTVLISAMVASVGTWQLAGYGYGGLIGMVIALCSANVLVWAVLTHHWGYKAGGMVASAEET